MTRKEHPNTPATLHNNSSTKLNYKIVAIEADHICIGATMGDNDPEMIILLELDRIEEVIEVPGERLLASIPDDAEAISSLQSRFPKSPLFNGSLKPGIVNPYLRKWQAELQLKHADLHCWSQEPPLGPYSRLPRSRANAGPAAFRTTQLYHAVYQLHFDLRYRSGYIQKDDPQLKIIAYQSLEQVLNKLSNKLAATPLFRFGVPPPGSLAYEELRKWHQSIVHKYRPPPTPAMIEKDGMLIPSGGWLALLGDGGITSAVGTGPVRSGQLSRVNIGPYYDQHGTLSGVYQSNTSSTRPRPPEGEAFSITHCPPRPELAVNQEDDTDSSHTLGRSPDSLPMASYQLHGTPSDADRLSTSRTSQSLQQSRRDQLLPSFFERQDAADERLGASGQQAVRMNVLKDKHLQGDGQLYGAQTGVAGDKALTRLQSVEPTATRSTEDSSKDAKKYGIGDQDKAIRSVIIQHVIHGDDKGKRRVLWGPRPVFDYPSDFASSDEDEDKEDKEDPVEAKRLRHLVRRMSWERNADLESSSEFDSSTEFEEENMCEYSEEEYWEEQHTEEEDVNSSQLRHDALLKRPSWERNRDRELATSQLSAAEHTVTGEMDPDEKRDEGEESKKHFGTLYEESKAESKIHPDYHKPVPVRLS